MRVTSWKWRVASKKVRLAALFGVVFAPLLTGFGRASDHSESLATRHSPLATRCWPLAAPSRSPLEPQAPGVARAATGDARLGP